MNTLTIILDKILQIYRAKEEQPSSLSEKQILQTVGEVAQRCKSDLETFQPILAGLLRHGNWVSVAFKQQAAASTLATFEKSISERQQHLSMLIQLLQGYIDGCWLVDHQC